MKQCVEKNDMELYILANVVYIEIDGVCNNGICYVNDVTIWTAGVQPHRLVRSLPFEKDRQNKAVLNDYYQVPTQPNVYVVGDCASSDHSPSAQLVRKQGDQHDHVFLYVLHHN